MRANVDHQQRPFHRSLRAILPHAGICGIVVFAMQSPLAAATQNWVPTSAGPFAYNTAANWNGGAGPAPGAADIANMQLDLTANQSVTFPGSSSVHQLLIGDSAQTGGVFQNHQLSGGQITFMGSAGTSGAGTLVSQNGDNTIANNLISSTSSLPGLTVNVTSGTLTLSGTRTGRFEYSGAGTKILTGSSPSGAQIVKAGTLRAGAVNTLGATALVDVAAGATLDLNNLDQSVLGISGAGTIALGSSTLTIQSANFTSTLLLTGTGGVTVNGTSVGHVASLMNVNAQYSGPTTLMGGTLQINSAANLGNGSATNVLVFAPGGIGGRLSVMSSGTTIATPIRLDADAYVNGNGVTFSGNITGAGGLLVDTLDMRLTGTNTYAGNTIIRSGTSSSGPGLIAQDSALGAPSAGIVIEQSGILGSAGAFTTSRSFTANNPAFYGGMRPGGGGPITFQGSGNNSFTGELWVRNGTLAFNRSGGTNAVTPGAKIVLDNGALVLGGAGDALSDGVDRVDVQLSNGLVVGTLNVTQGVKNTGVITGTGSVTVANGATLAVHAFRGFTTSAPLTVTVNGTGTAELRFNGYPHGTSKLHGITLDPAARFDIQSNGLVWDYAGASVKSQVRQYLINGRGGSGGTPTWISPGGITSSAIAPGFPHLEAIGYLDNADAAGAPFTSFRGLDGLDSSSIFVALTIPGDANLDFIVNNPDLGIVGGNYLQANVGDWYKGDFNYDSAVNDLDAEILGSGWDRNTTAPTHAQLTSQYGANFADAFYDGLANPVPEPSTVMIVGGATTMLALRRRRRGCCATRP